MAHNKIDKLDYALKMISTTNSPGYDYERAIREKNILKKTSNPYIVSYFESFLYNNYLCIVMEYVPGNTLKDIIDKQISINQYLSVENTIIPYFTQMLLGVYHLHNNNIIHRDIKPAV